MTMQLLSKLMQPTWTVMEYGWYPLLALIATPYFVNTLGAEKYGHWMLLTATVAFGGILNAGTGAAVIREVSSGFQRPGDKKVERTVRSALALSITSGGVVALVILLVFALAGETLFARMGDQSLVLLTGVVAAGLGWMEQVENVFVSALKGAEQFGRAAGIEMAGKTVQIIAAVMGITVWPSLAAVYICLVVVGVLRISAKAWVAASYLGINTLRPSFSHIAEISEYAGWGWLQGAGGILFSGADRMLIGSFLGATSLTHYSVATQLAQQIHGLSAAALSVVFPKVSRKVSENKTLALPKITKLTMGMNLLASSVLALGLLLFGRSILIIWLGTEGIEESAEVLWFLTFAYWLLAFNVAPHFIMLGIGRMRFVALSNIAAGLTSLICMWFLVQFYGLMGIATARILYGVIISVNCVALFRYLWSIHGKPAAQTEAPCVVEAF